MTEMPQQTYLVAAAVVGIGVTILGFFVREAINTSSNYRKGINLYQQKDYKHAEEAFRKVLSRHPSNDMVHLLLGEVLMQQDKVEASISEFRELISRSPKNVDAYMRLGTALVKQDNLEEAIAALEKARDLFKAQRNPKKAEQVDQLLQQIRAPQSLT